MSQLDPSSSQMFVRPEVLEAHFNFILRLVKRMAPLRVSLLEHVYRGVYPEGWIVIFGRHRTRVRFDNTHRTGMTVQIAEAAPQEWYPDWSQVASETVYCPDERSLNGYEDIEEILLKAFTA